MLLARAGGDALEEVDHAEHASVLGRVCWRWRDRIWSVESGGDLDALVDLARGRALGSRLRAWACADACERVADRQGVDTHTSGAGQVTVYRSEEEREVPVGEVRRGAWIMQLNSPGNR